MKKIFFVQLLVCAFSCGGVLYAYVKQQNDVVKVRIELPRLSREVRLLEEQNSRLRYEIERFENPKHLMELAKRPEYSHLKHPLADDIFVFYTEQEFVEPQKQDEISLRSRAIYIGSLPDSR